MKTHQALTQNILDKAREYGASLAGFVPLVSLREPTEHLIKIWPGSAEHASLLVLALEHPESEPELDWWGGEGGTEGNRRLISISKKLQHFLATELNIKSHPLPYHPWKGGVLLKDAATLAGLGCMGDHNLLITPRYGTHVRLRAILIDLEAIPEPVPDAVPCTTCAHPCWEACPQSAFASGTYAKAPCARQMELDEANAAARTKADPTFDQIPYCRACELACPVGR